MRFSRCLCLVATTAGVLTAMRSLPAQKPVRMLGPSGLMADDMATIYSPDGKWLLTRKRAIYDDAMYTLWDVTANRKLREFRQAKSDKSNLTVGGSVAFSPDGKYVAGGFASQFYMWDTSNAKVRLRYNLRSPRGLRGVAFSPDGKTVAAMAENPREVMTVHLFDVATRKKTGSFAAAGTRPPARFSANSKTLFVLAGNGNVLRYDLKGRLMKTFQGPMINYALTPGSRNLVAVGRRGAVIGTFSVATGRLVRRVAGPRMRLVGATFSSDGRFLALCTAAARRPGAAAELDAAIWDVSRGKRVRSFGRVNAVAILSPKARTLAAGNRIFEVHTGKELHPSAGPTGGVVAVAYTPGGRLLSLHRGSQLCLWDPANGKLLRTSELAATRNARLVVSPTGDHVLTSNGYLVEIASGKAEKLRLYGNSPAFSPDGKQIAAGRALLDVATGKVVRELTNLGRFAGYGCHAFSPDGKTLASGSQMKGTISLTDAATGKELRQLVGHPRGVYVLQFSPDGKYLTSTSSDSFVRGDQSVRIWDPKTGRQLHKFTGAKTTASQNSGLGPLAISPDSRFVASAFHDHVVRVWNMKTGKQVHAFQGHDREVTGVSFSHDGKRLASGSLDGRVFIWAVDGK